MSAIFGIMHHEGAPVARAELDRMAAVLAHCGPDGASVWHDRAVGLGHRMLHTTPESLQETLPWADPAADVAITADARLDNRDELRAALGIADAGISDSRLILAAYLAWGEDGLARLDGDFAFAIWDGRRQQLFCARDRFGLRAFYYAAGPRAFIFASEIKGVLAAGVPDAPNDAFLAGYLLGLFDAPQATAYRQILRLPAAHALTVSAAGVSLRPYWQLRAPAELRLDSDAAYADAFRAEFTAAVRRRMRAAYPVGTLLSGGLDSSSVTCVARTLLPADQALHAYSAVFTAYPSCDERPYLEAVTARDGLQGHQVPIEAFTPFATYVAGQALQDEPYLGTTHYLHWGLYEAARREVRIVLEGHGGDSVVSHGLTYLTELAARGHWGSLLREARAYAARDGWRVRDVLWEWGVKPLIPLQLRRGWRGLHEAQQCAARLQRAGLTAEAAARCHLRERLAAMRDSDVPPRSIREEQETELASPVYALIFDWFSIAALSHGLDVRYPFFDRRLVEFCLSLPSRQRLQDGWTRAVLRRAMDGILPPRVQWRGGKANLAPCFFGNLFHHDRAQLGQALQEGADDLAPYLDVPRVQEMYRQWTAGMPQAHRYWETIWYAATLATWLRTRRRSTPAPRALWPA